MLLKLSKQEEKRLYDIEYRRKNQEKIKARKKAYYDANKERIKAKAKVRRNSDEYRKKHATYCAQPDYRVYKHKYDVARGALQYGEFWESAILVKELEKEVRKLIPTNERAYYKRNVRAIVKRNKDKRINAAIEDIVNGHADFDILRRAWTKETKSMLTEFLTANQQ